MNVTRQYTIALSFASLLGLATCLHAQETVRFALDSDWELANLHEIPDQVLLMEFVRTGERIEKWSELVTVVNLARPSDISSVEEFLEQLKAIRERDCPEATEWKVIDRREGTILYEEWTVSKCRDQPAQYELAKLLEGDGRLFRVSYATRVADFSPEVRAKWIDWFSAVKIVGS